MAVEVLSRLMKTPEDDEAGAENIGELDDEAGPEKAGGCSLGRASITMKQQKSPRNQL